jgi:hypothetical protein
MLGAQALPHKFSHRGHRATGKHMAKKGGKHFQNPLRNLGVLGVLCGWFVGIQGPHILTIRRVDEALYFGWFYPLGKASSARGADASILR